MAGVDLLAVKEILGHQDIQTTMRYAHLSAGHLQAAVNRGSLVENRDLNRDQVELQDKGIVENPCKDGAPGRIRTCDTRIRSPMLYPS